MSKKSLLLVFIHGFKGDDTTFSSFPTHICAALTASLPHLSVSYLVYPQFETRGDLTTAVSAFQAWLKARVVEVEYPYDNTGSSSPSSTRDENAGRGDVRVVIVGHSMGGIVAAESVLALDRERDNGDSTGEGKAWWPPVQGILAFDTPYLGIAPGLVAHNAEGHWEKGKVWYESAAGMWNIGNGGAGAGGGGEKVVGKEDEKAAPAPVPASAADASAALPAPPPPPTSPWNRWSRYAMYAGAATAAVASTAAAAYYTRTQITTGWTWISSHLEFVGCLARPEELKQRLLGVAELQRRRGLGFANVYTVLGKGVAVETRLSGEIVGRQRTFCSLPRSGLGRDWVAAVNDMVGSEVDAHMMMFVPEKNPGYYVMSDMARELIRGWISSDWIVEDANFMQDIS